MLSFSFIHSAKGKQPLIPNTSEHSFIYFSLCKPCIIRDQCMLHVIMCATMFWNSLNIGTCALFSYITWYDGCHFVFKLQKRTQLHFILFYSCLKTQLTSTVLYDWTRKKKRGLTHKENGHWGCKNSYGAVCPSSFALDFRILKSPHLPWSLCDSIWSQFKQTVYKK